MPRWAPIHLAYTLRMPIRLLYGKIYTKEALSSLNRTVDNMAEEKISCTSCGALLVAQNSTRFKCPQCDNMLGRCPQCRDQSVAYTCKNCNFNGP